MTRATTDIVVGIVEDDPVQAELYSAMLASAGMRPKVFATAQEYRRRGGTHSIDVLLLDWNLPDVSGIDLLRSLRGTQGERLPVILLTMNSDERDVVWGLQCGADDYIVKPPRPAEMIARIRAAHRRGTPSPSQLDTHPFQFDFRARELRLHGEPVRVTEREFDLLAYFFKRPERIVSREMLLTDVWQISPDVNTRSIDTYVSRLRKSIGLNGSSGWKLEGVYQHGYRLVRTTPQPTTEPETTESSHHG